MKKESRCPVLSELYYRMELIIAPLFILLSLLLIFLSVRPVMIDRLAIGIGVLVVSLLMLIEGIVRKVLIVIRLGIPAAVYIIFGLFLMFESLRRLTKNFTECSSNYNDWTLFLIIFILGIHLLHTASLLKIEN